MQKSLVLTAMALLALSGCAMQKDQEELQAKSAQMEKDLTQMRADVTQARADLEATRTRLDNALRASADSSTDIVTSKQRINDLAGRFDEVQHDVDGLKKDVAASRTEIYARMDDLKRTQTPAAAPVAPITAPADKNDHFAMLKAAHEKRDWPTVRVLGADFLNRYAGDERADEALFYIGDGDVTDGRPTAALGSFNRFLKLYPKSKLLGGVLFDMGEAYMLMHDCQNAKTAFEACEKRFSKEVTGIESKKRLGVISKNDPGTCAPP